MPIVVFLLALVLAPLGSSLPVAAQSSSVAEVRLAPERPVQGSLFAIDLRPAEGSFSRVEGEFAGERLHFHPGPGGTYRALAAVPIDADGAMPLTIRLQSAWGVDTLHLAVAVAPGNYRMERLTVAPRFGRQPDAATAARIAAERERALEVSRRSHDTPRLWDREFVLPRPGRVTSGFGNGREFNGQVQSRHMGTDFAGAVGAPVRATASGVVALVDSFHLGGNVVYLDHGGGLVSGYLHLSRIDVAQGDAVTAGQVIGGVGATGRVTGPHLHWLVRYGGITVDPMSLLQVADVIGQTAPAR
jgi:murein DD-endopeptidase MepM/ murein hydrolase activator NlpD